jgi:hypothetical protein
MARDFCKGLLPTNLIAGDVSEYIQRESNARLATARKEGVVLDDMFIGRDCLPAWLDMQWNPRAESLHIMIQDSLLDLQVTSLLGDMIRARLTNLGNEKLEEARKLGLTLEDITIGKGLLPEWDPSAANEASPIENQPALEEEYQSTLEQDQNTFEEDQNAFGEDQNMFGEESANNETGPSSPVSSSFGGYETSSETDSSSDSGDTSDTDSFFSDTSDSSDDEDEDEESFDSVFSMTNAVDDQPQYTESDDEAPHILHDVEIAGGPDGQSDVDLEVYLAEDDDEAGELPEVELAIDATAYLFFFDDEAAVDVRFSDMELECTLEIPEDDSYDESAFFREALFEDDNEDDNDLDEDEDDQSDNADEEDEQDEHGINAQVDGLQESLLVPTLQNEDEEQNTEIKMTEDGFTW